MSLQIGFIMDPFEELDTIDEDTSCSLIKECLRREHVVFYLQIEDLKICQSRVMADVRRIIERKKDKFVLGKPELINLDRMQVIFMRKDPPFDEYYLYSTYILEKIPSSTLIINAPGGIRKVNEKLYTLNFPDLCPQSIVSRKIKDLKKFLLDVGGQMIVKPLNECSGRGVIYVKRGEVNLNSLLEMITRGEGKLVIAQEYIPQVREKGDKRILLLEGEPVGAMCRVPPQDDYRANIHRGARYARAKINPGDRRICSQLAPYLRSEGIYFAGIDVIGGKLVEVNVTSPAGIPEVNRLSGTCLEKLVMDWVEKKVEGVG